MKSLVKIKAVDFQKSSIVCSTKTEVSNFHPEKVFCCPCLLGIVTECWEEGLRPCHQIYDKIN